MMELDCRLASYDSWPHSDKVNLNSDRMATAGFYYLGRGDEVRCAFCKVEIMNWHPEDDAVEQHIKWSPACGYLVTIVPHRFPRHPKYATEASRIATYDDWPTSMAQTPEQMAEAGFVYNGVGDKTFCFYCGGGLKNWERTDDPWREHALWYRHCGYLRLVKGDEYVDSQRCESSSSSSSSTIVDVQHEDERRADECILCLNRTRNVAFQPCGHLVCCGVCSVALSSCPMCRGRIDGRLRIIYS